MGRNHKDPYLQAASDMINLGFVWIGLIVLSAVATIVWNF